MNEMNVKTSSWLKVVVGLLFIKDEGEIKQKIFSGGIL